MTIDIIPPFSNISREIAEKYLWEDKFEPSFTVKKKAYYNFVRPMLPVSLRRRLQARLRSKIKAKEFFIDDRLVKIVFADRGNMQTLKQIYPNGHSSAIVLTHDVESKSGFSFIPKVMEIEKKYNFKSSWNIVPYQYPIDQGIIRLIQESGHEIGIHGYSHDGRMYLSKQIFDERVPMINKALDQYGAVGFRSPMVHRNLVWLQELDIEYDCSCFDYDPYQPFPGGTGSIWPFVAGKFVELPYTLPQDHTLFYVLKEKNVVLWKKKTDWILEHHGMVLTLTHPDYLMARNHLRLYEELLQYLLSKKNAWHCLPREMAAWWKKKTAC